ncbi:MAG: hypothetical protein DI629_20370 [Mesorhizobium amorphae]|nr:MAG: hypothetical protein DI629_20370 [Mesorhizobium amorphae]
MPKSRNRRKKPQGQTVPFEQRFARLWEIANADLPDDATDADYDKQLEAEERLETMIQRAFADGRMSDERVVALVEATNDSRVCGLLRRLSGEPDFSGVTNEGEKVVIVSQTFVIPIMGNLTAMKENVEGALNAISRSLRASGMSRDRSNVILSPRLYSPLEIGQISDQAVYDANRAFATGDSQAPGSILPAPFSEEMPEDPNTLGVRFLIGIRHYPVSDDAPDLGDGLSPVFVRGDDGVVADDLDDMDADAFFNALENDEVHLDDETVSRAEEEFLRLNDGALGPLCTVLPPAGWETAGDAVMETVLALQKAIVGEDVRFDIGLEDLGDDAVLRVKVFDGAVLVSDMNFPAGIIGAMSEEWLEDLMMREDVGPPERDADFPSLH